MPRKKRKSVDAEILKAPSAQSAIVPIDAQTRAQLISDFERFALAQVQKNQGAEQDEQCAFALGRDPETGKEVFFALTHDLERAERMQAAADRGTQLRILTIDAPSEDALTRQARLRFGAGSPLVPELAPPLTPPLAAEAVAPVMSPVVPAPERKTLTTSHKTYSIGDRVRLKDGREPRVVAVVSKNEYELEFDRVALLSPA